MKINISKYNYNKCVDFANKQLKTSAEKFTELKLDDKNVIEVLNEILPYIEADGGWLEYVETEEGYVKVRLGGACSTCAMSSQTLKMGIEKKLMMEIPEVKGVVQVL